MLGNGTTPSQFETDQLHATVLKKVEKLVDSEGVQSTNKRLYAINWWVSLFRTMDFLPKYANRESNPPLPPTPPHPQSCALIARCLAVRTRFRSEALRTE